MKHRHDIILNDVLARSVELACEAVWPRRFIDRHLLDGRPHLLLGDGSIKVLQVMLLEVKVIPAEIVVAQPPPFP